jgi:hypothetical protein
MGTSDGLGADPLSRFTILCRAEGWAITFDALPFQTFRSPLSVDETAAIADATAKAREMIAADREAAEPYGGDDERAAAELAESMDETRTTIDGTFSAAEVAAGFNAAREIAAFLAEPGDWNGGDVCEVAADALIKAGLLTVAQCNN